MTGNENMKIDLPIDAVFADAECTKILGLMLQTEDLSLIEIDLWTRIVAFHYFLDLETRIEIDQSGLDYHEILGVDWSTYANYRPQLVKYGLMRKDKATGAYVACKPCKILSRIELQRKVEKVATAYGTALKGAPTLMGSKESVAPKRKAPKAEVRQLALV